MRTPLVAVGRAQRVSVIVTVETFTLENRVDIPVEGNALTGVMCEVFET